MTATQRETREPLTLDEAVAVASEPEKLAEIIGIPIEFWVGSCHEVSLALVRAGKLGRSRVARGVSPGIASQHSWAVAGDNVYDSNAVIIDATNPRHHTLWERGKAITPILVTDTGTGRSHHPHGYGSIWEAGKPYHHGEADVTLTPQEPLSRQAQRFLAILGPLDQRGWAQLAHLPVGGWPAKEIISAMADTEQLAALIPIDIVGMVTDRNPRELYW